MAIRSQSISKPVSIALSLFLWVIAVLLTMFYSMIVTYALVMPYTLLFDWRRKSSLHWVARIWARSIIATSPVWNIEVEGKELIKNAKRPFMIIANHQSMLDILVLLAGLPLHFKFIAKEELFRIPFIGWHMSLAQYIALDRSSRESGRKTLLRASQWIDEGVSLLFFPEGTRSLDGKIHEFKPGAFKIAIDKGIDILPVVILGTAEALPKKSWRLEKKCDFFVSIAKPISPSSVKTLDQLIEKVRKEMIERQTKLKMRMP